MFDFADSHFFIACRWWWLWPVRERKVGSFLRHNWRKRTRRARASENTFESKNDAKKIMKKKMWNFSAVIRNWKCSALSILLSDLVQTRLKFSSCSWNWWKIKLSCWDNYSSDNKNDLSKVFAAVDPVLSEWDEWIACDWINGWRDWTSWKHLE